MERRSTGLAFLVVLLALMVIPALVFAVGTDKGTNLVNTVKINYNNAALSSAAETTALDTQTVTGVYGETLPGVADNLTATPGDTVEFLYTLTNKANTADTFNVSLGAVTYLNNGGVTWTVYLVDKDGTNKSDTYYIVNLGEDATETFIVRMVTTGTSPDQMSGSCTVSVGTLSTPAGLYTGSNGIAYGGPASVLEWDTTQISAPIVYMAKAVYCTAPAGYVSNGGGASDPVPGAILNYNIKYDNDGSGVARSVVILDTIPVSTAYKYDSMDTANVHTNGNSSATTIEYYIDGSWTGTKPANQTEADSVVAIRVTFATGSAGQIAGNNGDAVATVNADVGDVDAGRIYYSAYIK